MKKRIPYSYCIFYLERKYYQRINQELKEKGYDNIRAIIPTVKILRKTLKGKMMFEEEPILFNFGFMKIPTELAYSRPFLNKLKKSISGIRGFLKSTETMHSRKLRKRIDNAEDWDDFSLVATCPKEDVRRFKRLARENKRFSISDFTSIKPGDYVVLRGYPYEGVDATILEVDLLCKRVKCLMYPEMGRMEVWLPFDNVLYSVYLDHDPDKLYANRTENDPENITSEEIDKIMNYKRRHRS